MVYVARHAMTLHKGAVSDGVRHDLGSAHVGDELRHPVHSAAASAGVDHRVVCHSVGFHASLANLCINGKQPLGLLRHREALQDCRIDHIVHQSTAVLVRQDAVHQFPCILDTAILYEGI